MNESVVTAVLIAAKVSVGLLGGAITWLAYRAARRTGSAALRLFAVGFGLITVGGFVPEGLIHLPGVEFRDALLVRSLLTLVGFGVLFRSLHLQTWTNAWTTRERSDGR